jgi:hypothetical protein
MPTPARFQGVAIGVLLECCIEIRRLENFGERLHHIALALIFKTGMECVVGACREFCVNWRHRLPAREETRPRWPCHMGVDTTIRTNPLLVMKWKEIIDLVEWAMDAAEWVAHVIEWIVMENG